MPSVPLSGVQTVLAATKATTWNTGVVLGALHGLSFLSGDANRDATVEIDQSRGSYFSVDGTPGPITCAPKYNLNLRYNSGNNKSPSLFQAAFMGTVATGVGNGTAKTLTYNFSKDTYGIFVTIAKGFKNATGYAYVQEVPTAQVVGLTISGEVGPKPLTMAVECIGSNRLTDDSGNNKASTFANVTLAETANPVLFSQLTFWLRAVDATVLSSGDAVYPSKVTLSMKRTMKGEFTGEYFTASPSQDLIDQPSNNGAPELTLTLEFPKHTDAAWLTKLSSDTRMKLQITATGGVIAGSTDKLSHKLQFPHLQLLNVNPTDDNGRIKEPLTFRLHGLITASTGMAGITDPVVWTETGILATSPIV
jgi:hypothetical protein